MSAESGSRPETSLGRLYAKIDLEGRSTFSTTEDFPLFEGSGEKPESMVSTWLEFTPSSLGAIKERVLDTLEESERETGISLYLAGRDFPVHSTLLQGKTPTMSETEVDEVFSSYVANTEIRNAIQPLAGMTIPYKYLLMDKRGNLILVSAEIPEAVVSAREKIGSQYQAGGLNPATIPILHITIARVRKLPDAGAEAGLARFADQAKKLRHEVSAEPLEMSVGAVKANHGNISQGGPIASLSEEPGL